jgi:hypothetical protein
MAQPDLIDRLLLMERRLARLEAAGPSAGIDLLDHSARHDAGGADALATVPNHDHTGDTGDGAALAGSSALSDYSASGGASKVLASDASGHLQLGAGDVVSTGQAKTTQYGCRVTRASAQTIPTSSIQSINWDSEDYDTGTLHDVSTNNERLVLKAIGKWRITLHVAWDANATGARRISIRLNGSAAIAQVEQQAVSSSGEVTAMCVTTEWKATAITDYVEARVWQNSGSGLNVGTTAYLTSMIATYGGQ